MDSACQPLQRLQFLDLNDLQDDEILTIERVLYSNKSQDLDLPWETEKHDDPPVEQEWSQQQYDERPDMDIESEDPVATDHNPQPPRNTVYPSMVYIMQPAPYMPTPFTAFNAPQQYGYAEMDPVSRAHVPRPSKKDKKPEPYSVQPYIVPYPQAIYPPFFPPVHLYSDYHHTFIPSTEQPAPYPEEQNYVQEPVIEMAPIEVKEEVVVEESVVPELPSHEHLCYHANVTLKPPKRKQVEEVPQPESEAVETSAPFPPAVAEPVEPTPVVPEQPDHLPETKSSSTDYPELPAPSPTGFVEPPTGPQKSWVSLFESTTETKPIPVARVPPFDLSQNAVSSPSPALTKIPASVAAPSPPPTVPISDDPYTYELGALLRAYQLDHRAMSLQPRGLTNRSNWCYVNAILQALIACPSFYNLLKALPVPNGKRPSSRTPIIDALVEFVNSFQTLPPNVRNNKRDKRGKEDGGDVSAGSSFEPSGVYKVLDKIRGDNGFAVEGRQEDAEEFLSCLLNGLNDEMFEVMKLADTSSVPLTNGDAASESETGDGWKEIGPKNKGSVTRRTVCGKTPVSDIFRGQLRSRVQRANDEYSDIVQPFFTLQLDVEKAGSVKDALELLVGKDPLEGMTCSKTNKEVEAWTQITLEDLPLILILHLKCFDYKQDGCSKIIKSVDFTVDLKVDPKLMSVNKNKYLGNLRNYKLVAVVYHDGKEATKGHYITDAYHVGLGTWIRYDDGNVRAVKEDAVLNPKSPRVPYLLCYRRADTTVSAPGGRHAPPPSRNSRP